MNDKQDEQPKTHKVVCISLYHDNIAEYKERIKELKRRGYTKANLSWLVRQAMAAFDEGSLPPPEMY